MERPDAIQAQRGRTADLVPRLDFAPALTAGGPLADRVAEAIAQAASYLRNCTVPALVELLADGLHLDTATRDELTTLIEAPDHVGLLLPSSADRSMIDAAATDAGLRISGDTPSRVFSEELRELAAGQPVSTHIYWLHGEHAGARPLCVEAFVADADIGLMDGWLAAGVGTHVALRVRDRAALDRVQVLLAAHADRIPHFMHGAPMQNAASGSTVLYYDLPAGAGRGAVRVEMHHMVATAGSA